MAAKRTAFTLVEMIVVVVILGAFGVYSDTEVEFCCSLSQTGQCSCQTDCYRPAPDTHSGHFKRSEQHRRDIICKWSALRLTPVIR